MSWEEVKMQIEKRNVLQVETEVIELFEKLSTSNYEDIISTLGDSWLIECFGSYVGNSSAEDEPKNLKDYHDRMISSDSWILKVAYCFAETFISSHQAVSINIRAKLLKEKFNIVLDKDIVEYNVVKFNDEQKVYVSYSMSEILSREKIDASHGNRESDFFLNIIKILIETKRAGWYDHEDIGDLSDCMMFLSDDAVDISSLEKKIMSILQTIADDKNTVYDMVDDLHLYELKCSIARNERREIALNNNSQYISIYNSLIDLLQRIGDERDEIRYNLNRSIDEACVGSFINTQEKILQELFLEKNISDNEVSAWIFAHKVAIVFLQNGVEDVMTAYNNHLLQAKKLILTAENENNTKIRGDREKLVFEEFTKYDDDYLLNGKEILCDWNGKAYLTSPSEAQDNLVETIIAIFVQAHLRDDGLYSFHSNPAAAEVLYKKLLSSRAPTAPDEPFMTADCWKEKIEDETEILKAFNITPAYAKSVQKATKAQNSNHNKSQSSDYTPPKNNQSNKSSKNNQSNKSSKSNQSSKSPKKSPKHRKEINWSMIIWAVAIILFGYLYSKISGFVSIALTLIAWRIPKSGFKLLTVAKVVNIIGTVLLAMSWIKRILFMIW